MLLNGISLFSFVFSTGKQCFPPWEIMFSDVENGIFQ